MTEPVVVRFAPSPTGPPHLGSLRTALFDWLLARATGGRFILRIEDTDRSRYSADAEQQMIRALHWLGLDWDEGPDIGGPHGTYRQSARLDRYEEAAKILIERGYAYHPNDAPAIVRLRIPESGSISFHDAIRGEITFAYRHVPEDPVLIKSDGFPTYHLAAMVDDVDMGVTHILRGDEWIPSTPLHLLVFEGLEARPPVIGHLPLVTDKDGKKLAKRDPRFLARAYIEAGYWPPAMLNYLALLGWHPGSEEEVFTPEELIAQFSLDRLSKSPSAYDDDRLRYFNRQHVARMSRDELVAHCLPLLTDAYPESADRDGDWLGDLIELVRDELTMFDDVVGSTGFAFGFEGYTDEAREALASDPALPAIEALKMALNEMGDLDADSSSEMLRELRARFKESDGWGGRKVMFPLRAALTGSVTGPHLSDVVALLGKAECLRRIEHTLAIIDK